MADWLPTVSTEVSDRVTYFWYTQRVVYTLAVWHWTIFGTRLSVRVYRFVFRVWKSTVGFFKCRLSNTPSYFVDNFAEKRSAETLYECVDLIAPRAYRRHICFNRIINCTGGNSSRSRTRAVYVNCEYVDDTRASRTSLRVHAYYPRRNNYGEVTLRARNEYDKFIFYNADGTVRIPTFRSFLVYRFNGRQKPLTDDRPN